jgi:hypothetical protein
MSAAPPPRRLQLIYECRRRPRRFRQTFLHPLARIPRCPCHFNTTAHFTARRRRCPPAHPPPPLRGGGQPARRRRRSEEEADPPVAAWSRRLTRPAAAATGPWSTRTTAPSFCRNDSGAILRPGSHAARPDLQEHSGDRTQQQGGASSLSYCWLLD